MHKVALLLLGLFSITAGNIASARADDLAELFKQCLAAAENNLERSQCMWERTKRQVGKLAGKASRLPGGRLPNPPAPAQHPLTVSS